MQNKPPGRRHALVRLPPPLRVRPHRRRVVVSTPPEVNVTVTTTIRFPATTSREASVSSPVAFAPTASVAEPFVRVTTHVRFPGQFAPRTDGNDLATGRYQG